MGKSAAEQMADLRKRRAQDPNRRYCLTCNKPPKKGLNPQGKPYSSCESCLEKKANSRKPRKITIAEARDVIAELKQCSEDELALTLRNAINKILTKGA